MIRYSPLARAGKRILREPLLHFLVLGVLLLAARPWAAAWWSGQQPQVLQVSVAEQERLRQGWQAETGRAPTAAEFQALLAQHIDKEILIREARRLGLHRRDSVVRTRLVNNLRFAQGQPLGLNSDRESRKKLLQTAYALGMAERDLVVRRRLVQLMKHRIQSRVAVSEQAVRDWYDAHPEHFTQPARYRVEQMFFDRERRGEAARPAAHVALARLRQGVAVSAIDSDPFLLAGQLNWTTRQSLNTNLGAGFADAVAAAEPGDWLGPIGSVYGLHLVRVVARKSSGVAPFAAVRSRVSAQVFARRDEQAVEAVLDSLRTRYDIRVAPSRWAAGPRNTEDAAS